MAKKKSKNGGTFARDVGDVGAMGACGQDKKILKGGQVYTRTGTPGSKALSTGGLGHETPKISGPVLRAKSHFAKRRKKSGQDSCLLNFGKDGGHAGHGATSHY